MLNQNLIDKVQQIRTTLNEISVYNLDVKTSLELYYELAKKVNEVINELIGFEGNVVEEVKNFETTVNNEITRFENLVSEDLRLQNEKITYMLNEGLKLEVGLKIDDLIQDGTMDSLINHKIFNDLNTKIDTYKQQTDEQFNTIASELEGVCNNIKSILCDDGQYVKGDGVHDDTSGINNAFKKYKHVILREGNYLIDTSISIKPPNGCTLEIQPSAKIVTKASNNGNYSIIDLTDSSDINIFGGGKIIGDRDIHIGSTGEWGMGINLRGSTNVLIKDIEIKNCWGDGIYIGKSSNKNYCENIKIYNVKCDNNRRQGISLISGKNIDIDETTLCNTNGTAPQAGLDIEANSTEGEILENINIGKINSFNNKGGALLYMANPVSGEVSININDINSKNEVALSAYGNNDVVSGCVIINNINSLNSNSSGVSLSNFVTPNLKFMIKNLSIINNNKALFTSDLYSGGLAFLTDVDNVYIENYYFSTIYGTKKRAISSNISTNSKNILISNLNVGENDGYIFSNGKIDILKSNMEISIPASLNIADTNRTIKYIHNKLPSTVTLTDKLFYTNKITIVNEKDEGIDIRINDDSTLMFETLNPTSKTGGYLKTRDIGSSVTLSKKDNVWRILSINGNWTYE